LSLPLGGCQIGYVDHTGCHQLNRVFDVVKSGVQPYTPVADQNTVVSQYAELIPQLASMARSMVRDLDPQNNLQFLRIRSKNHEIMVHSDVEFTLIVIQNPAATE
jgi:dynein light chain roadblock-type